LTRPSCGSCACPSGDGRDLPLRREDIGVQGRRQYVRLSQLAEYPLRVSLKCEPQLAEQLRATYSAAIPGYHLNKFVTGLYQASEVRYDLDEPWLAGAMTIVIVLALMIVAYFIPEDRRLRAMAERDIAASGSDDVAVSPAYERRVRLEGALGAVAGGLVLAAVFLMVTKPGL